MSPSLPPELLQEILGRALEVEPPAARQQTRIAFGAVCRLWRVSVNEWKALEVLNPPQLHKLVNNMSRLPVAAGSEPAGTLVRSVHLELLGASCVHVVKQTVRDFNKLVSLIPNVEKVVMIVSRGTLVDPALMDEDQGEDYDGHDDQDLVGPVIGPALSTLRKVKHFVLSGPGDLFNDPWLSGLWLKR